LRDCDRDTVHVQGECNLQTLWANHANVSQCCRRFL
jgi:hypothetical protein